MNRVTEKRVRFGYSRCGMRVEREEARKNPDLNVCVESNMKRSNLSDSIV